ncbi:MAG: hypothetical protein KDB53_19615, partial [Planctomycetes bacterium]|nr:hypothetical protein [Planctomycetota bacterium]
DPLDPVPPPYRHRPADPTLEHQLWARFWTLATDPGAAREAGVAVAQCKAVSTRVEVGRRYCLRVDEAGLISLTLR